ncbi:MAG: tetratricopeptide repeat protein [Candidatus Melainabacteria bacterium]
MTMNRRMVWAGAWPLAVSIALCYAQPAPALTPDAYQAEKAATQAAEDNNTDAALMALKKAQAADPSDYLILVKMAGILTEHGKYNEAASLLKQAMAMNSQDPMLAYSLASLYEQMGKNTEAESLYRQSLQKNPAYQFAHLGLARVLLFENKTSEAAKALETFLVKYPAHLEARRLYANTLLAAQQFSQAASAYETLRRDFPDQFTDYLNYAKALNRSEASDKAVPVLQEALQKNGARADLFSEMGLANVNLGQDQLAIQNYTNALKQDPKRIELWIDLGNLYQSRQKYTLAIEAYKKYLEKDPSNLAVQHNLALAFLENKQYNIAQAMLGDLLKSATDESNRYLLQKELAYTYQAQGNLTQAIARYETLLDNPLATNDLQLKTNLAIAYHKQQDLEKAITLYKEVYYHPQFAEASSSLDPRKRIPLQKTPSLANGDAKAILANDMANAMILLGDRYYEARRYAEAIRQYGEALPFAKQDNPLPYIGLGNAYFASQQLNEARQAYQAALVRDPKNKTAQLFIAKLDLDTPARPETVAASDSTASTATPAPTSKQTGLARLVALAEENPDDLEIQLSLADAYMGATNWQMAVSGYKKALGLKPSKSQQEKIQLALGACWQQLHNIDQARQAYEAARLLNPENPLVYYNLGIVYNEMGRLSDSVSAYQVALRLKPTLANARYGLALTLDKQKRYDDALGAYEQYITLGVGGADPLEYSKQAMDRIEVLRDFLGKQKTDPKPAPAVNGNSATLRPANPSATSAASPSPDNR